MSDNEKEAIRATECDWNLDFEEKKGEGNPNAKKGKKFDNKVEWMSFKEKGDYRVRLVGKAIHCIKYSFVPFGKNRVITHKSYFDEDPAYLAGFTPSDAFAIHVIDRADGKLKILEKGMPLFRVFADYIKVNEINPSGKEGPDFVISVSWPDKNKQKTKYTATPTAKLAPLTADEIAMIRGTFNEGDKERAKAAGVEPLFFRLQNLYKATDIKKIKELWDALPEDAKTPKEREPSGDAPAAAAPAAPKVQPKIVEPEVEAHVTAGETLFEGEGGSEDSPF